MSLLKYFFKYSLIFYQYTKENHNIEKLYILVSNILKSRNKLKQELCFLCFLFTLKSSFLLFFSSRLIPAPNSCLRSKIFLKKESICRLLYIRVCLKDTFNRKDLSIRGLPTGINSLLCNSLPKPNLSNSNYTGFKN